MKVVLFARHGQTKANEEGLLAGSQTDSPLTPLGEEDASRVARNIAGKPIDLIVCSPLVRTGKTAEIVAHAIGYTAEIVAEPLFTERDFGSATNLPKSEAFKLLDNGTAVGVEPVADFSERAQKALEWLRKRPEDHILVVSHAGFGQMIGTIAAGGRPEDFLKFDNLSNGGVFEFTLQ